MKTLPFTLSMLLISIHALTGTAHAQTVWRCESNSYSNQPCASGHALDVADARSPEQLRAGQEVAQADRRLTRQMALDRQAQEHETRQAVGSGMTGFKAAALTAPPEAKIKSQVQPKRPAKKPQVRRASSALPPSNAGT